MLDDASARDLLKSLEAPKELVEHSEAVRNTCVNLIDALKEKNPSIKINKRLVCVGALLHDIGRTKSQGLDHGIQGAKIIRELNLRDDPLLEKVARICERHLGAGITNSEAEKQGLPPGDYVPKTMEEKIIAYCDNLVDDENGVIIVHDPAWAAIDFEKKHGKRSEPARMVRELNRFFEELLNK
jgi:uncharacterized protein